MTRKNFLTLCKRQFAECLAEMSRKGGDYATDTDVHANFKDDASDTEIPIRKAIGFHLNKQYRAIRRWYNGSDLKSEPIESRITDTINYLLLLRAWVEEEKDAKQRNN